jgi:hypothetical protein
VNVFPNPSLDFWDCAKGGVQANLLRGHTRIF